MKTIVLLALGLVGTDAKKHRNHLKQLNSQTIQSEIEHMREQNDRLNSKMDQLSSVVKKVGQLQSFVQKVSLVQQNRRAPVQSITQLEGPAVPFGLSADKEGKPIPGAPANPSPQPFTRGEKQWMDNAQNIGDWGENQMEIANARIPYSSTVQLQSQSGASPNMFGLSVDKKGKPIAGSPAQPSPQPFVRGEKQWMDNAQNIGDWGENQMEVANARIPYMSTLQLDSQNLATPNTPNMYGLSGDVENAPIPGSPAQPSPQPFVRGEKQWMDNAQNIGDWGDQQMTVANERIPYWSTLQLDSENMYAPNLYGLSVDKKGKVIAGSPAQPTPQPFVRGEKQWMDNAQNIGNWGENQMEVANARIPYMSTFLQTNHDDNPDNIETMAMEDPSSDLPLNGYLVHVETKDGDELMRIVTK